MARKTKKQDWMSLELWSPEFAAAAIDRFDAHQKRLERSKTHDRVQRSWRSFYSRDKDGNCDLTQIGEGGTKGEILLLQPARYARLIRDHVTLVQQTPTKPEPMAANSDPQSQDQVKLGRGVCEHYKREFDLEGIKAWRALVAEICGVSFLHVPWDPEAGRERLAAPTGEQEATGDPADGDGPATDLPPDSDEEGEAASEQKIIHEGDNRFEVRTIYEVAFDRSSPDPRKPRWWVVKAPFNRWDMLSMVREEPESEERKQLEHAILNAETWSSFMAELEYDDAEDDEFDDSIPVYYVYGEASRTCPDGRMSIVVDKKNIFIDGPLGDPRAPVFRLSQGEVLFRRGEATTANHDGLPLADAIGAQFSTILSNSANHGIARVLTPRKANLVQEEIDAGAAAVNYDHVDASGNPIPKPEIWNPPANNPELYQGYSLFTSELDIVMGGSPVTRGDPNATKGDSGSKVAALFAAAQNVGSSFVADVLRSEEELYTFLIQRMALRATLPRMITIVGEKNTFATKEYLGQDISQIPRVTVGQADPMRDTLAGKLMIVEAIEGKTPEEQKQIVAVMSTGRLESVTDPTEMPRMLLERENEALRKGDQPVIVRPGEPHREHWLSHDMLERDPEIRKDPAAMARIAAHKKGHEDALTPGSPTYAGDAALLMTGQQPIPVDPFGLRQPPPNQQGAVAGDNSPQPAGTTQPQQSQGGPSGPGGMMNDPTGGSHPGGMPAQPNMPKTPRGQPMPVPGGGPKPQGALGRPSAT